MPDLRFDRFYRHAELTALLHALVAEFPQLAKIQSLGKSHEGRDIWLVTLTHAATGA
jgi:hypothetical protein